MDVEYHITDEIGVGAIRCADWVAGSISDLLNADDRWTNPFSKESYLNTIERFYYSITGRGRWWLAPATEVQTYGRWLSGNCVNWNPTAYTATDIWSVHGAVRKRTVRQVQRAVDASVRRYSKESPAHRDFRLDMDVQTLKTELITDATKHSRMGRLFRIFGGILEVESQIRLVERRMKFVFPEVHRELNWHYPDSDFAFELYLNGGTESEIELAFLDRWKTYLKAVSTNARLHS